MKFHKKYFFLRRVTLIDMNFFLYTIRKGNFNLSIGTMSQTKFFQLVIPSKKVRFWFDISKCAFTLIVIPRTLFCIPNFDFKMII